MSSKKPSSKNTKSKFVVDKTTVTITNGEGDWVELSELDDIEGCVHGIDVHLDSKKRF